MRRVAPLRLKRERCLVEEDARRLVPMTESALVKARFESSVTHNVEHLWVKDACFEGEKIVGTLASDPVDTPESGRAKGYRF